MVFIDSFGLFYYLEHALLTYQRKESRVKPALVLTTLQIVGLPPLIASFI